VALSATLLIALFVRNPPQAASGVSGKLSAAEKWRVYRNPRVVIVSRTYGLIGLGYIVQTIFMVRFMVESGHGEVVAGRLVAMSGLLSVAAGLVWGGLSVGCGWGNVVA